jgi:hypothetical protein
MFVLRTCILMFVLDIYICDVYICDICDDIYNVSFVCLDGIEKTNKKCVYWSLCRVLHSAKRGFAECQDHSTRQKKQDLSTGIGSLPSVVALALGKE